MAVSFSPPDPSKFAAGGVSGATHPSPVVVLRRVSKRFERGEGASVAALEEVSLEVHAGEVVALVGPSGCGKSTTLNLISGVDRADGGELEVCGVDLRTATLERLAELRRRSVGIVFQAFHLMAHLTAEENIALPLALDGREDGARVAHLLDRVGLTKRARHYPPELSGGEQQRVALARAMVHRPRVLLADEPTGNLDSAAGAAVLQLILDLAREERAGVLLVTHDDSVARAADRIVRMRDGRVVDR